MFYTYILKSGKGKRHYIGSTEDLMRRVKEHNQGKTKSIKHLVPLRVIYYEAYETRTLARKRELELKNNSFKKKDLFDRLGE